MTKGSPETHGTSIRRTSIRQTPAPAVRRAIMPHLFKIAWLLLAAIPPALASAAAPVSVHNVAGPYEAITVEFKSRRLDQSTGINPFSDYRLDVTFSDGKQEWIVPGYFAGCADAADKPCTHGRVWRAHLVPTHGGDWTYSVSFRTGPDIIGSGAAGQPVAGIDGQGGRFTVSETPADSVRARGLLRYTGGAYYRWSGTGAVFFKLGADAPENTLAYEAFDATPDTGGLRKDWAPHLRDYDPSTGQAFLWGRQGKGAALLGMFRYLDKAGVNTASMLMFNVGGDDGNVFPHLLRTDPETYAGLSPEAQWSDGVVHDRFNLTKLAQWQRALAYADSLGLHLHIKLQETENDAFKDAGRHGRERRIYLREMLARFNHFLAVTWNLGEENTQTSTEVAAMSEYVDALDPYDRPIVLHTFPQEKDRYRALLGDASRLNGLSLQTRDADFSDVRREVIKWTRETRRSGRHFVVSVDEAGSADAGAPVDLDYPTDRLPESISLRNSLDRLRQHLLWGALTAGANGIEIYYGYKSGCSDLTCQDHRTRASLWRYGSAAIEFFDRHIGARAFDMRPNDGLTRDTEDFVFADEGRRYLIYTASGAPVRLRLSGQAGFFDVHWYDAINGGPLQQGSTATVQGGRLAGLGAPPAGGSGEWAVLVRRNP